MIISYFLIVKTEIRLRKLSIKIWNEKKGDKWDQWYKVFNDLNDLKESMTSMRAMRTRYSRRIQWPQWDTATWAINSADLVGNDIVFGETDEILLH